MIRSSIVSKIMGLNPKTVIHVGAHKAQDHEQYKALGAIKIIWCEADDDCVNEIMTKHPDATVVQGLFWSKKNVTIDFWLMNDRAQNSVFNPRKERDALKKKTMKTTTIDSHFLDESFPSPILLVLDVQGAEKQVLAGASGFLNRVDFLICEITKSSSISEFSVSRSDIHQVIRPYSFIPTIKRWSYTREYYDLLFVKNITKVIRIKVVDILTILANIVRLRPPRL